MPNSNCCITFLTDFGTQDTYVGQMKGVALGIDPGANLIDLTHEIPPQQVLRAAYVWADAIDAFDPETVHVAVVDPGVGSDRRLIAAEIGPYRVVCPDNGLLTVILRRASVRRAVVLNNRAFWRAAVSDTFHGRDILTPVAVSWGRGADLSEFGSPLTEPLVTLTAATPTRGKTSIIGQVIHVDRFGNLITNITAGDLPVPALPLTVEIGSFQISGLSRCYTDVPIEEPLALMGSSGRLEISIRNGNAAEEFNADFGRRVVVRWEGSLT
jgi:S-adenosylmethionine hydrolase